MKRQGASKRAITQKCDQEKGSKKMKDKSKDKALEALQPVVACS
jgi:hypothetical protein